MRDKNKTIIMQRLLAYLIVLKYTQLIKIFNPDGVSAECTYDPFGRRISKTIQGEKEDNHKEHDKGYDKDDDDHNAIKTTYYVYDNQDILMEYDQQGEIKARYIHGSGIDEHLAIQKKDNTYFYHADGLGSIVALTDNHGKTVQTYSYDSFGSFTKHDNKVKNIYAFTGRIWDEDVKLYDYRNRDYDPKIGRFITKDPSLIWNVSISIPYLLQDNLQDPKELNPYLYTQNNPVNYIDPSGLFIVGCKPPTPSLGDFIPPTKLPCGKMPDDYCDGERAKKVKLCGFSPNPGCLEKVRRWYIQCKTWAIGIQQREIKCPPQDCKEKEQ